MRVAIISDTHFGDKECTLVNYDDFGRGPKYASFAESAGQDNDFLILLGDIFDFSISSYEIAYKYARPFFQWILEDKIAKNIIYVPGNHDFDMWQTVQYQIKVIYQVRKGRPAKAFQWSLPGVIDDRSNSNQRGFQIPGVTGVVDPDLPPTGEKLFLNNITKTEDPASKETNFYFVYPNIYFVTDNESVLVTHGQYLEPFWTFAGEWIRKIAGNDLGAEDLVEDLVALNVPLCQLACSGLGQAGKLTPLIQKIEHEAKAQDLTRIKRYLDTLVSSIDALTEAKLFDPKSWGIELVTDLVTKVAKDQLLSSLKDMKHTRYSQEFMDKEDVVNRFKNYYQASWNEIQSLNLNISVPRRVIFGHTHVPVRWLAPNAATTTVIENKSVNLFNTGGWLWKKNQAGEREFCEAEVFIYDSDSGFESKKIS
jgi:UDP-2,3-diacylglucosamine pyrophosphatase LpxH